MKKMMLALAATIFLLSFWLGPALATPSAYYITGTALNSASLQNGGISVTAGEGITGMILYEYDPAVAPRSKDPNPDYEFTSKYDLSLHPNVTRFSFNFGQ